MLLKNCTRLNAIFMQRSWRNVSKNIQAMHTIKVTKTPHILVSTINFGEDERELMELFPQVVRDLTEAEQFKDIPLVNEWFARVLQYNVPTGTKSKSLLISRSYKSLVDAQNLTSENKRLVYVLTWCFEMIEAYMAMYDDILDSTEVRRNAPSWYTLENVGMNAINDGVYLENAAYFLLNKYFSNHPKYIQFTELFHEIVLLGVFGQVIEIAKAAEARANSNIFTMESYLKIRKYKAGYFPFYIPITLGMHFANKFDQKMHNRLIPIFMEMGYILMIQNDLRDAFNNLSLNGEIGTDIAKGRYSWMIVTAHQVATDDQKEILKKHYGRPNLESVLIVKNLYEELNLPNLCINHIEERLKLVRNEFQRISRQSSHPSFLKYLESLVILSNWHAKEYWCT